MPAVRVVPFDELPAGAEASRAALQLGAFSSFLAGRSIRAMRRRGYAFAEYAGLFALDRRGIVGQTFVFRFPYTGAEGTETVAGIASVTTRADAARRGVARAVLAEVHRREAEAGCRYALLWTNRGWYAHGLYEKLGYRDVYSPSMAARAFRRGPRGRPGESLKPPRAGELARLERLHEEILRGRHGFVPRGRGFLTEEHRAGLLSLDGLRVYRRRGRLAGYAVVGQGPGQLTCGELVASPADREPFLAALEAAAAGRVLALGNTTVHDLAGALRRRRYVRREGGDWHVLMACRLGRVADAGTVRRELAADRATFTSLSLDRF